MGIDVKHKHQRRHVRKGTRSRDPYMKLLVKLYRFLARRTQSRFNKKVAHRMMMSRVNRPIMSLSKLTVFMKTQRPGTIAVSVSKVVDDNRLLKVPQMLVCALRFSERARKRITNAGGRCLTFDQLAVVRPTGSKTLLVRGSPKARTATKYFGKPAGGRNTHTRARVSGKGRKFERASLARK
eukprot:TRINITY_DN65_c0_g2_i1.p1 TRINITY_DN65_c0_g2~~TRINITY_DN65_c0_g2_i1.p1  ORF type:complete len:182 (+),score=26.70 TRINITY_DN65_c0_g2_i1:129-674(+)